MSIGKSGKNLAFVQDDSGDSNEPVYKNSDDSNEPVHKDSEDNVSVSKQAGPEPHPAISNPLFKGKNITARGYILIISLAATIFAGCTSYSLIAPFFPRVAEAKGLSISQYSLVFAVYEILAFVLPPTVSKLAIRMTPKVMLMTSLIICAVCATTFGTLIFAKSGTEFFVLCLVVRVFWSVGGCTNITTVYLCGTLLFPNHISTIYAAIEIGAGLGFMAGPSIGGWLYELGGFTLPFIATSMLCLLSIIPIHFLVQNEITPKDKNVKEKPTTILQALSVPGITINLTLSAITCLGMSFNESTLDFHLREIGNFSPSQVGKIFLISGLIYSFFTWGFGWVAKKWSNAYCLIYLGLVLLTCSFVFVGPLPFLPIEPSIYNVIFSQACFGVGMGILFVLSFDDCVKESKKHLPNNDSTMATISALYTSSYALGTSLGPLIAGQLVERFGYRTATIPMVLIMILLIVLVTYYIFKITPRKFYLFKRALYFVKQVLFKLPYTSRH